VLPRRFLPLLVVSLLGASLHGADPKTPAPSAEDVLELPDLQVAGGFALKDFDFPAKGALTAPDFSASDPFLKIQFPGQAVHEFTDARPFAKRGTVVDKDPHCERVPE